MNKRLTKKTPKNIRRENEVQTNKSEEKLINAMDNMNIDQTERLIDSAMKVRISEKERNRIKNNVLNKIGRADKKRAYIPRGILACAAALAIIFTSFFAIGFDNVAAAIKSIFTFVPGIGIGVDIAPDKAIYAMPSDAIEAIESSTKGEKASILRAVYANGYLSVTVQVDGKELDYSDFDLFINELQTDYQSIGAQSSILFSAPKATLLNLGYPTDSPKENDIYEIQVAGFTEKLTFKLLPCSTYDDIAQIGPTAMQNGLSITATAQKIGDKLVVWCYSFDARNEIKDLILGYGNAVNASYNIQKYIRIGDSKIYDNHTGWSIKERMVFDMPQGGESAMLHIPYLAMNRKEEAQLSIEAPKAYNTIAGDASVACSLGTISITEIKKEEDTADMDKLWLKVQLGSNDIGKRLYSFDFETEDQEVGSLHFNPETGCLESIMIRLKKDANDIKLNIGGLYYYQDGEYEIPLEIK